MTDWRPNWRDSTAYSERLTDWQWRWEFLRRDEEYQADFARLHPADFARQVDAYRDIALPDGVESWEQHFKLFASMPGTDAEPGCREKYGVEHLWDPAQPKPSRGLFVQECPYVVRFASEHRFRELDSSGATLMAFDLRRPLRQQLKRAEQNLKLIQVELYGHPREHRQHRAKWARYLRIFDAKAAGAAAREIATKLRLKPRADATDQFDPDRLVHENLRQAQAIQLRFNRAS